ncbi:MAG: HAMP domain-containing histidine kinase [Chitinophagaceae bacterium]|nr:HAMP domain-containing histidine kinase [Chitinophagaceae bacterium]
MNKLRWLASLMVVAILGITAFQLYWLRQNYQREKRSLLVKTDISFKESVFRLQAAKLKLSDMEWEQTDSTKGKVRITVKSDSFHQNIIRTGPRQEIVSTINVIRSKLKDSLKTITKGGKGMVIMTGKQEEFVSGDSLHIQRMMPPPGERGNYMISLLYGVDSLQDSLRLMEIDSAYNAALRKEHIDVPFSISRSDSVQEREGPVTNEVTVGLANPVTYKLQLGNTTSYLLRQILQPILLSILLLGITILSFVLLYRNLVKQKRLAALKNEFISNITHELKTPIATVGVAIEALKNFNAMQDTTRTKEYLDISANELQRLNLLVDKVLKLSMFEKKEVEMKPEPVNLTEIVQEVAASLKLQLEKHKATMNITSTGDTGLTADKLHLVSLVFNLADNALKYSKDKPAIQVNIQGGNNEVIFRIADNGIGIAPEYKDKIFDKFFRVPHGDTHDAKGYGLGLSYVHQVVKKHNGTIEVESEPGKGTTFTITLPKNQPTTGA